MRVGIIGCGLIGTKRARALAGCNPKSGAAFQSTTCSLVAVADTNLVRAQQLAGQYPGCVACTDWREVIGRHTVDAVLVATTNDSLASITQEAIRHGKHVLVEKPGARAAAELVPLLEAARETKVTVMVGFNHRFHPALAKAHALFLAGAVGPLLYIRGRYGHGGRLGYDREWRADPVVAGGGELLDQGVHLIDLARWFAGDFVEVDGHVSTFFWNMAVEDNGFLMLRTAQGQVAWLHASCTEWKNLFCFEIFGRDGKLQIDGLGGSYGVERLTFYRMLPQMGPPETTIWEYPGEDLSWQAEFNHFVECIRDSNVGRIANPSHPSASLEDALAALQIVGKIYEQESGSRNQESGIRNQKGAA